MNNKTIKLNQEAEQQRFLVKVFGWMSLALILTGAVAYYTSQSPKLLQMVFSSWWSVLGITVIELLLVAFLVSMIEEMTAFQATIVFMVFSAINGFVLSGIFIVYTTASLVTCFFVTAGTFLSMSAFGYLTKMDLSKLGGFLFMALIGLILAGVTNMFLQNSTFDLVVSAIGVIVFTIFTAYDVQKIKETNVLGNEGTEEDQKEAIIRALSLYLDFINLFLYLLRFLGHSDDD